MYYACLLCLGVVQPWTLEYQVQPSQHTDSSHGRGGSSRHGELLVHWAINGHTRQAVFDSCDVKLACLARDYSKMRLCRKNSNCCLAGIVLWCGHSKQLLDEVFVLSRIIKVEVRVNISRSRRQVTLTETLIILDITKTELLYYTLNEKNGSHVFFFFTDEKQHKAREIDVITLRNHPLRSYMT